MFNTTYKNISVPVTGFLQEDYVIDTPEIIRRQDGTFLLYGKGKKYKEARLIPMPAIIAWQPIALLADTYFRRLQMPFGQRGRRGFISQSLARGLGIGAYRYKKILAFMDEQNYLYQLPNNHIRLTQAGTLWMREFSRIWREERG